MRTGDTTVHASANSAPTNANGAIDANSSTTARSRALALITSAPLDDFDVYAVFDSSDEALILVDAQGVIRRANRRACELIAAKSEEVVGSSLVSYLAQPGVKEFESLYQLARSSQAVARIDGELKTGFSVRLNFRARLGAGQLLLLCLEEGSLVQRADGKWRQVEAELLSVLDSVQAGVVLVDLAGRLRYSNARFTQYFGLERDQLRSTMSFNDLEVLISQRFRSPEGFAAPWRSFANGEDRPGHDELEMLRPARRVLERFARPVLDREGMRLGWLELYYDVTGERQIQAKLLQTEKMAAVGQLVSGIAHELNNPLTSIMGYGQLLLAHGLDPAQFSEASKVFNEAERARRIVKNLLYFARENEPERTRVNLNEIVERTLALRSYELKVEDILIECSLAQDLPETMADPYQLQQVVLNLLVNAEQALLHGRGKGKVRIRTRRAEGNRIAVDVSDDGPGIPREIISRIFDPFFTTKPAGLGTGLGLSIVYGIVKQHDGEVTAENQHAGGARFTVELPVVEVPAPPDDMVERELRITTAAPRSKVLVVEDEPTVAQLIVDVLREEGHQVEAVLDSQEGLTRLSRSHYDLIICDLRMPRLDGPAFYEALVRSGSAARDRMIFITGDTLAPRTMKFLQSVKVTYLAKPFLVEELKLAVNRRLESMARVPRKKIVARANARPVGRRS
jgi:signal transduction histidine kinase/ActR/RegA family two-component response regulator